MNEGNCRKRNMIVFGLPEQNQSDQPQVRADKDKVDVGKIFRVVNPHFLLQNASVIRLGQFGAGKNGPVKVVLQNETQVINLIKKASNLKNSAYTKISLSFDRTRRQIDHYKKSQEDIKNCKMRGKKILEMCQAASLSSTNISPTQEQQTMDFEKLMDQAEMVFDNTDNNVDSRENLEEPRSPKFRFSRTTE
ncbi:unnamed protein product [Acanthoscelides obtectus]|uniref:Uncharacterized protein n=1 Tax=Acanthoscelides obtectus TaxID=200917 RepID=A0A9P0MKE4_ACAOB|nr:unnamed protein product [Acanthoscelides obtectus]CAK1651358.1 hypothetical protein AOBTE_LOCUS17218 [Acanthoscelides obtectus]